MEYIEVKDTVDKSQWVIGEWTNEHDYYYWVDQDSKLDCLIVRSTLGNLCGYVGLPAYHSLHGKSFGNIDNLVNVHGGLTYSDSCEADEQVCHHTENDDVVWWLGFDCGHYNDYVPAMSVHKLEMFLPSGQVSYKNVEYVIREVENLAKQLIEIG